jgi:hypothetical protein
MAKDPGARFRCATDLAQAALAALGDPTVRVRAPMVPVPSGDVNSSPSDFEPTQSAWWQPSGPRTMMAPPAAASRRRRRRTAIIGAVLAVLALGGSTAALVSWRTGPSGTHTAAGQSVQPPRQTADPAPPTGTPATDVPSSALRSILLTATEIPGNTGDSAVVLESDGADLLNDSAQVDNADCLGAWAAAQQPTYADSGYTDAAVQVLRAINQTETQHRRFPHNSRQ